MKLISKLSLLFMCIVTLSHAQNFDNVTITTTKLSEHVYMLTGAGGNIGISIGKDGVFIIDDQFAPLSKKILATIRSLSNKPLNYLVNTHYHGDHTGGNKNMSKAGATIIAHDNVKKRLANRKSVQQEALPVITFNDQLNIDINGETIAVFHVDNAHTDGDVLLYFTESNVLHTGDTYFSGRYPYVDIRSGGSFDGYIEAVKRTLILIDNDTKIIPGHGELSNKEEYKTFLKMLETLKANILTAIKAGKTEEEIITDSSITKEYDDLGYGTGLNMKEIRQNFYKSILKSSLD